MAVGHTQIFGGYRCGYVGAEYRATPRSVSANHAVLGIAGASAHLIKPIVANVLATKPER